MSKTQRICSWCGANMGWTEEKISGLTHGICPACLRTWNEQLTDLIEKSAHLKKGIFREKSQKSI